MNCEACGHPHWDHSINVYDGWYEKRGYGLCGRCKHEPKGGPCFPWEFR